MKLEKKFLKAQSDFSLIQPEDKIIVGFSGGSDSVVLTHLLLKFKDYLKISNIILVHVNHKLRGIESEEDEKFALKFAKEHNLNIEIRRFPVKEIAEREKKSIEEVAREIRYKVFKEVKDIYRADKIATAHHISDLTETMVMWFIQGNKKGMKGFKAKEGCIIRPLYYALKEEIIEYADKNNLTYRIDTSNLSLEFLRNKIRIEVIPVLKKINPSLENSLLTLSNFLFIDDDYLDRVSDSFLDKFLNKNYIDLESIKEPSILYRIIQKWVYKKTGVYLSYSTLLEILSIINKGGSKTVHISNEYMLEKEYNKLFIKSVKESEKIKYEYKFRIGESIYVKEAGVIINSYIEKNLEQDKLKNEKNMVCFEIPDIKDKEFFVVRNRKPGDRFIPFGRSSERKLKDVMIDLKIPKSMRESIPLLVFRDKILWIVGYKRSAHYPVSNKGKTLVCFEVKEV